MCDNNNYFRLKSDIDKRDLGMTLLPGGGANMLFWSPYATSAAVEVKGKGVHYLQKKDYGYWEGICGNVEAGDRYMVLIDDKKRIPDPASLYQPEGVHSWSEVVDTDNLKLVSGEWKGLPVASLIIYELHTGTFSPEGTFEGIAGKLDYLVNLGITAIELMPVAQFTGDRNWGYDGVYPFAVQNSYGGPRQLADLVRSCHDKGIAVILDVVYNHLGPEGNYLSQAAPYFTDKYKTPWGSAINFDDAWSDGVRRYFIENALMWMRDFAIDGLRLDAVHAIKDFGANHFLAELAENVAELNQRTGKHHFLIAESDLNDVKYISPLKEHGYGMNSQWCDEFHHALHALLTGERKGYYSDFGKISHLAASFNNAYVYDGKYSSFRKRIFGSSTEGMDDDKFVVFIQNHDQVGNRMLGERLGPLVDFETLKLAAGSMFVSAFIPMLFMGEEYNEDAPFLYFTSHGDKELIEAVREGRKKEFADFIGDKEAPDPHSEETFNKSKLQWNYNSDVGKKQLLEFYKKLIHLKKNHPALKPGRRESKMAVEGANGEVICLKIPFDGISHSVLEKIHGEGYLGKETDMEQDGVLTVILNFSDECIQIPVAFSSTAGSIVLLYSAHRRWGGPLNDFASLVTSAGLINIDRRSILILSDKSN